MTTCAEGRAPPRSLTLRDYPDDPSSTRTQPSSSSHGRYRAFGERLSERGVGVRYLADPIRVDSSDPAVPMVQLAVVLLALFGQMEGTYTLERAAPARAPARAGAPAKGRRVGRLVLLDQDQLDYTAHLRDREPWSYRTH